jgi:DNA primase
MRELELGLDLGRITIPVRDEERRLIALLRYAPWPNPGQPKMLAAPGSQRVLLPHPAAETSPEVLLVEGEPDMVAARSHDLPAIAVPGVDCWRAEWAPLFTGRRVTIVMDADAQGRALAARIALDLDDYADTAAIDIAPDRSDGYDLSDLLRDVGPALAAGLTNAASRTIWRARRPDEAG